jgi:hypothetical protein
MTTNRGNAMSDQSQQQPAAIQKAPRAPLAFVPANLDEAWRIAEMLSKSGILPDALRGKPHDILVTVMTGTELGLSPMQSIRDVYVVKGRGYVSSLLKVALVKQSQECEFFRCVETSATKATFTTRRKGEGETTFSFTLEEAKAAGLIASGGNWEKYPALMLRRRCSGQLADEVYPDVVRGIGDSDDVRQAAPVELNAAPPTWAPPAPALEEAQLAPPSPPSPPAAVEAPKASRLPIVDAPAPEAKPSPPKQATPKQSALLPEEPNDLAVFAAVQAVDPAGEHATAQLDAISPAARKLQGPVRAEISAMMVAKRKAIAALKAGK